jgi:hypothetical protein
MLSTESMLLPLLNDKDQDKNEQETQEYFSIDETELETMNEFVIFHATIFDTIEKWYQSATNTDNPFLTSWHHWEFLGLMRYKVFTYMQTRLSLTNSIRDYIDVVKECPDVPRKLGWQWKGTLFLCWFRYHPGESDDHDQQTLTGDDNKLRNLCIELMQFANKMDVSLKTFHNRIVDINVRLDATDDRIKNHGRDLQGTLQQNLESSCTTLTKIMNAQVEIFQRRLTRAMDTQTDKLTMGMTTLANKQQELLTDAELAIDRLMDQAQHDLFATAEEATNNLNTYADKITKKLQQTSHAKPNEQSSNSTVDAGTNDTDINHNTAPTSRWNVDPRERAHLENFTPRGPSFLNDNTQPNVPPSATAETVAPNQFQGPPDMIYGPRCSTGPNGLPWLQFDNFIKRTKITLTDTEDTIIFYNQLYNVANHYGVFLCQLQGLQINMLLCLDSYNGVAISAYRKQQMGNCLYQLLQNPDVIPLDFTWARNVINRFVEDND